MTTKPTIIYVSGAPGAGKTTLAKLLSEQLYVPHISSDLVHGGVALTNPDHDRRETLHNVFVPTMIDLAKRNVNFIADHVLQKGVSEAGIISKLKPYANIIYVHVETAHPVERYKNRVETSTLPSVMQRREHLLDLVQSHADNLPKTSKPLDLDVPTITVNTDYGYSPDIDTIVAFIRTNSLHSRTD
jgi:cytidylate kinase